MSRDTGGSIATEHRKMLLYSIIIMLSILLRQCFAVGNCDSFKNLQNELLIPAGNECILGQSIDVSTATVSGTIRVQVADEVKISASDSITISSGGKIVVDPTEVGGLGSGNTHGSGGGYGGRGGSAGHTFLLPTESASYGNFDDPKQTGSAGGGSHPGNGGGILGLTATNTISVDGVISVNGGDAKQSGSGGGSGGSVAIETSHLTGSGVVLARGGRSVGQGGGGSGGRIVLKHQSNDFRGHVYADGGISGSSEMPFTSAVMRAASYSTNHSYIYGKLGAHNSRAWRPRYNTANQWLEAQLSSNHYITSIETGGGPSSGYYVTAFTVQYYNDSTNTWIPLGDSNFVFQGRHYRSTVQMPWPIYTSRVRLYVKSWHYGIELAMMLRGYKGTDVPEPSGLCSPSTRGEPGGPGTVYFNKPNNVSTVVIDNLGKFTDVALDTNCSKVDITRQGAAAYILHPSSDPVILVVTEGSHVVLSASYTFQNVIGSKKSVVHVTDSSVVSVNAKVDVSYLIYPGSTLQIISDENVVLNSFIYMQGKIQFVNSTQRSVTVSRQGNITVDTLELDSINVKKFEIQESGLVTIKNKARKFSLTIEEVFITGTFTASLLQLNEVEVFSVDKAGSVRFDPVTSNMLLGTAIDINGTLILDKYVHFESPCKSLHIDGSLTWPETSDTIILDCSDININNVFPTANITFGDNIDQLTFGENGRSDFQAVGPVKMKSLHVYGHLNLRNAAVFQAPNTSDSRIETVFIHGRSGSLTLNSDSNDSCSVMKVRYLMVDGSFNAGNLSIGEGIDEIDIGKSGDWVFNPCRIYHVHEINVEGKLTSIAPIHLEGKDIEMVHVMTVGEGGTVTFDSVSGNQRPWSGVSKVALHTLKVYGKFYPGKMKPRVIPNGQWDSIEIYEGGTVLLEIEDDFIIDNVYVNGDLTCLNTINIYAKNDDLFLLIDSKGSVTFDSLVKSNWVSQSKVIASKFIMNDGSQFQSGDTNWTVTKVEIAGQLYSQPTAEMTMVFCLINSTGRVDFSCPVTIQGVAFTIQSGGLVDFAFQHDPDNMANGSEPSQMLYREVHISGKLQAGSLHFGPTDDGTQDCERVTISGTIDVTGGGYLSDEGPGKGKISYTGGSGASHGGRGGRGAGYQFAGYPYGSIFKESMWGSGGGSHVPGGKTGGRGGGFVRMYVKEFIQIEGSILSNGLPSTHNLGGGGSGGNLFFQCENTFTLTGHLYSNGGSAQGKGGGGAGGRVHSFFKVGHFHSGLIQAKGGGSVNGEPGGPGMSYLQGNDIKNLRVDNGCQQPFVSEPTGDSAGEREYANYTETGAIAYLNSDSDNFEYDFTHVELYGGAHLTLGGNGTTLRTVYMYGDDTGHLHIGPGHTLEFTEVSEYKRTNITFEVFLYENAKWILPDSTVVFRAPLDQRGLGMPTQATSCPASLLRTTPSRIFGFLDGRKAHLLVSSGATLVFGSAGQRSYQFENLTIQDEGVLELKTRYGEINDVWTLVVRRGLENGQITVEAGGKLIARNLKIDTDILKIDKLGLLTLKGQGLVGGEGQGDKFSGGSYGGKGGGKSGLGYPYGSVYNEKRYFGSGGSGATSSDGTGGGAIELLIKKILVVEGVISVNGDDSASYPIGGGSGGYLYAKTHDLEGSGSIQVAGGAGTTQTGGGGGGRIAILYNTTEFWFGSFVAKGGSSVYGIGGAGTVYLKDMRPGAQNETFIIDNGDQNVAHAEILDHLYSLYENEGGRTWLSDSDMGKMDTIKIINKAHVAIQPNLTSDVFRLEGGRFIGDTTGTLHIGPNQTVIIEDTHIRELLINVYIYEGGTLVMPDNFICRNVHIYVWGTLKIRDMTVGEGCTLYLSRSGNTNLNSTESVPGVYAFYDMTVSDGGEITTTADATGVNDILSMKFNKLLVKGGGLVHATHVNIEAVNVTVDDLGRITGDLHSVPCSVEYRGGSGSGILFYLYKG